MASINPARINYSALVWLWRVIRNGSSAAACEANPPTRGKMFFDTDCLSTARIEGDRAVGLVYFVMNVALCDK